MPRDHCHQSCPAETSRQQHFQTPSPQTKLRYHCEISKSHSESMDVPFPCYRTLSPVPLHRISGFMFTLLSDMGVSFHTPQKFTYQRRIFHSLLAGLFLRVFSARRHSSAFPSSTKTYSPFFRTWRRKSGLTFNLVIMSTII